MSDELKKASQFDLILSNISSDLLFAEMMRRKTIRFTSEECEALDGIQCALENIDAEVYEHNPRGGIDHAMSLAKRLRGGHSTKGLETHRYPDHA